jgi:hypothetical protein
LSAHQCSPAFGCDDARINAILANRLDDSEICGRYWAFNRDSKGEILELIEAQVEKCQPITPTDLWEYCEAKDSPFDQPKMD